MSSQKCFLRKGNTLGYMPQQTAPQGQCITPQRFLSLTETGTSVTPLKTGLMYLSMCWLTQKIHILVPGIGFPHTFVSPSSKLALLTEEKKMNLPAFFCFYQRCLLNSFTLDTLSCILHQILEKFVFKNDLPNSHQVTVDSSAVMTWHERGDIPPWHGLGQDTWVGVPGAPGQGNQGLPEPSGPWHHPQLYQAFLRNQTQFLLGFPGWIHSLHTYSARTRNAYTNKTRN